MMEVVSTNRKYAITINASTALVVDGGSFLINGSLTIKQLITDLASGFDWSATFFSSMKEFGSGLLENVASATLAAFNTVNGHPSHNLFLVADR